MLGGILFESDRYSLRYYYDGGELYVDEANEAYTGRNRGKMITTTYRASYGEPLAFVLGDGSDFKDLFENIAEFRTKV